MAPDDLLFRLLANQRWFISALATCAMFFSACLSEEAGPYTQWNRYEGEPGATSFSALDQIDRTNVGRLEIVWTYERVGAKGINPLVVDTVMYVLGSDNTVVAIHAGSGIELWSHTSAAIGSVRHFGFNYWESNDRADRRLFFQKGNHSLLAVDALTGEPISSFGDHGRVDLREGLGVDPQLVNRATSPSPGAVFEDLLILGSYTGEGYVAAPGHIRAFDVRTGRQVWIFHTLPKPGEFGYDTWPEGRSDNAGGANAWGGMSVDEERGIVYAPLGSANYDFYGVDRPGENLFANSLLALDARTGERIWHYQTVHHDLWDYDLAATPVLLTVERDGKPVDIVAQATKTGMVFTFDRVTGEPLWPIEERPVPTSDMPGEQAWPTQPFPTKPEPFVPLTVSLEEDLNPYIVPAERDSIVRFVRNMHYEGLYTPPSTRPTLQAPGNRGGANWGSTAGDPRSGAFFVLSFNMPSVLHLLPIVSGETGTGASEFDEGQQIYQEHCQSCHGANLAGQPAGGIPSLADVTGRLSHVEFEDIVRNGRNLMPAWPHLDDGQLETLQLFLANPELALVRNGAIEQGELPPSEPLRYQSAWRHVLDSKGVPAIGPPWFRLTAYDLNEGSIKWQIPIGDVPHLVAEGILNTGSAAPLRGGPAITAGNLVFQIAGDKLKAYDLESAAELWAGSLPAVGDGIPAVYEVDGRQYVVVAAPGKRRASASTGSAETPGYVAFALPDV